MEQPTYDDVNLILRLYELRREEKMRAARKWFMRDYRPKTLEDHTSLCPPGSQNDAYFRMLTSYWNMVASFVNNGIPNPELFFQSGGELIFVWEKIHDLVPQFRESMGNSSMMKSLETAAKQGADLMEKHSPGSYEKFSARVRGM